MHARRRLPVFAAVNISAEGKPKTLGQRPPWSYDPRIAEEHQPDDSLFSSLVQRGHMAARDYVVWGRDADERHEADIHSFTLTNVCPQIRSFNGQVEWYKVEREVAGAARAEKTRLTEFVGPILRADDPPYDDLRSDRSNAARGTGIRVPLQFWKIVAWVEDGKLKHKAFILDQSDEVEEAGPLELDIETPEGVKDSSVEEISKITDLEFAGF
jgi:endonuclease G